MNAPTPNQNQPNPDFDFIMKQPGANDGASPKRNRKVIVLVVLIVITVILLIVGALLSSRRNVVENPTSTPVVIINRQEAEPVIKDFLNKTASADYEGAYANVAASPENPFTKDVYISQAVPLLNSLKLEGCILAQQDDDDDVVIFGCSSKDGNIVANLEFVMVKEGDVMKIVYYRLGQVV